MIRLIDSITYYMIEQAAKFPNTILKPKTKMIHVSFYNSAILCFSFTDKLWESCRNAEGATLWRLTGREMIDVACSLQGSKQAHDNRFNQWRQQE